MDSYLVEFRLSGSAKKYVKQLAYNVARRFNVQGVTEKRVVPHVTIFGPFKATDEKRLIRNLEEVCNNYDLITFMFKGFRSFGNWLTGNRVLAVNIEPSTDLNMLRSDLVQTFAEYCKLGKYDRKTYKPHATIAFKDIGNKFGTIKNYLDSISVPEIQHFILRITLLKNAKILCEYDLLQHRILTRREALNRDIRKTTLRFLRHRRDGICVGFSSEKPLVLSPVSRVFLISDLHLDHTNIIRYCNRPFYSKEEMNKVLVSNWNAVIGTSDLVFFLGDLTLGPKHHTTDYWLSKLNGRKFFIHGNHDADLVTKAVEVPNHYFIKFKEYSFMLTHKPIRPAYWNGWIVHGEVHNNHLDKHPFINYAEKTINVSVEVIDYKPILIDRIISEINK